MSEQFKPNGRYYALGDYYRGTVFDWERKIPIATVNISIDGAKTQSATDAAQFIADLLNRAMTPPHPPQPPTSTEALSRQLRQRLSKPSRCGCGGEYSGHDSCADRALLESCASALLASSAREQEMAELMSQKLAACDVAALSNTPQTYGPPLHQDNPFWSPAYESVRAAVLREMQHRDRAEQAEAHAAALQVKIDITRGDLMAADTERKNLAREVAAMRGALTEVLDRGGDTNDRARRLLESLHAPSDPAASVDAGERHDFRGADGSHPHCVRCHVPLHSSESKWNEGRCAAPPKAETPTAKESCKCDHDLAQHGITECAVEGCACARFALPESAAPPTLERDLASVLNRYSAENASNTPDFILAQFLLAALAAWNTGVQQRETWYGRDARPTSTTDITGASK